jgi:hypothetical protein
MSSRDPGPGDAPVPTQPEPSEKEAIQDEIEHTREDLGETISALSAKTDVKGQASAKADEFKQRTDDVAERVKRRAAPIIVGGIALLMILGMVRRRRRRRGD